MISPDECVTIDEIRAAIDELDRQLVATLSRRFAYVKAITRFKKTAEDVAAPVRVHHVISTRRAWAAGGGSAGPTAGAPVAIPTR